MYENLGYLALAGSVFQHATRDPDRELRNVVHRARLKAARAETMLEIARQRVYRVRNSQAEALYVRAQEDYAEALSEFREWEATLDTVVKARANGTYNLESKLDETLRRLVKLENANRSGFVAHDESGEPTAAETRGDSNAGQPGETGAFDSRGSS